MTAPDRANPRRKYDRLNLFRMLILLRSQSPMSRKKISDALMIGEGSTRALLDFLHGRNYIKIQKRGASLTSKGSLLLKGIQLHRITIDLQGLAVDLYNVAILVKSGRKMVKRGLEQRDEALKGDATGATTLIYYKKKLVIPTSPNPEPINDKITDYFQSVFNLEDDDVVIIGSGPNLYAAESGALAAGLSLLPKIQKMWSTES